MNSCVSTMMGGKQIIFRKGRDWKEESGLWAWLVVFHHLHTARECSQTLYMSQQWHWHAHRNQVWNWAPQPLSFQMSKTGGICQCSVTQHTWWAQNLGLFRNGKKMTFSALKLPWNEWKRKGQMSKNQCLTFANSQSCDKKHIFWTLQDWNAQNCLDECSIENPRWKFCCCCPMSLIFKNLEKKFVQHQQMQWSFSVWHPDWLSWMSKSQRFNNTLERWTSQNGTFHQKRNWTDQRQNANLNYKYV